MRPPYVFDELTELAVIRLRFEWKAPAAEALMRIREKDLAQAAQTLARGKAARTWLPAIGPLVVAGSVDHGMAEAVEPIERGAVMVVRARPVEDVADVDDPTEIVRVHIPEGESEPPLLPPVVRRVAEGSERE